MSTGSARTSLGAFLRNGWMLMSSNVAQAIAGFASQLVLMRLLGPQEFGGFAVALAGAGLVQVVLSPRLGVLVICARDTEYTEEFRQRLYSAMAIEALACLVAMVAWLALTGLASVWSLLLAATLTAAHWLNSVTLFYERGLPYRDIAVLETGSQLAGHGLAVALVLAGAGVATLYLREAAMVILRGALLCWLGAIPRWRLHWVTWAEWRSLLAQARVPWLDGIAEGAFQRLMVLTINALAGWHGAGLFFQAQRLALVPHQILSPMVVRLAGNLFARMEETTPRRRTLAHVLVTVSLPLASAAAIAWAFGEPLVPLVFGSGWAEAGPVLAAMAGSIFTFSLFELARSYCLARRLHRLLLAGRAVQYATLGIGCLVIWDHGSALSMAYVLSAVTVASALTLLGGLVLLRGKA